MVPRALVALIGSAILATASVVAPSPSAAAPSAPSPSASAGIGSGTAASAISKLASRNPAAWLASHGLGDDVRAVLEARSYAVRAPFPAGSAGGAYEASNPAQRLRAGFTGHGVEIRPGSQAAGDWRWGMQLSTVGRGAVRVPVGAAALSGSGNRVEYRYESRLTEWYVNTPRGVEQGFTLEESPAPGTAGPVELVLAVSGDLSPQLSPDGDSIRFVSVDGGTVLGYRDLHAWDARGRPLPSRMTALSGEVRLVVDDRAAVYPVTVDPLLYVVSALTPTGAGPDDDLGFAVAISGNTAVIGAPSRAAGGVFRGSAFVFVRNGASWQQQAELTAPDGEDLDAFGFAVAISGDTIVVGAPFGNVDEELDAGAAYVFVRTGSTWSASPAKLTASDGLAGDSFAFAVAISGDTIAIGAPGSDPAGKLDAGAAYVFTGSGATWTERAKLLGGGKVLEGDVFGLALAVTAGPSGNKTLLVSAPFFHRVTAGPPVGRASVFVGSGASWTKQANLVPSDGAPGDAFGVSVAVSGNTAVIGAFGHDPGGKPLAGQAYVFARTGTTWAETARLTASDGAAGDEFGAAVDIDGKTVVVGAPARTTPAGEGAGLAYVFVKDDQGWKQRATLDASQAGPDQFFGLAAAISGDTIVVGAPYHSAEAPAGPAYAFSPSPLVARVWVGLKNSDAVGLRLDLRAEVSVDDVKIAEGQSEDVSSGSSGFNNAILQAISMGVPTGFPAAGGTCAGTTGMCVRVTARVSCFGFGHESGIARLWYNGKAVDSGPTRDAGSRVELPGRTYLRFLFTLNGGAGMLRLPVDRSINDDVPCPARPFAEIESWTNSSSE